ncbi:GDSL-type esterase/lipase family protein [Nocardia sp. NPDC057440]|uniref:GDSL-type esterase/lipase family protein n=1 Tax=Nocardia sp. NPDC057440 TaxID=3346134 RepID=UPI00366D594F
MTATSRWIAGFRSALVDPAEQIRLAEPRSFTDQTLRQVLHMAGGGEQLRVRLTNRYGRTPLTIGAARIAVRKAGGEIVTETDTEVRFGGATRVTIPAGSDIISDTVDLAVTAGTDLALSLYLPGETEFAPFAQIPAESAYVATGNHTAAVDVPDAEELTSRFYVTGIDVPSATDAPLIVAFGDSWFEGVGSSHGANRRSVDVLNERLTAGWAVNQGTGGNRLLTDEVGDHGLARFDRDVLDVPGVTHVLVNFGINDLIVAGTASVTDLIAGFTLLAQRAHAAGLPIYANTVGPFAGVIYPGLSTETGVPVRNEINEWLRTTDVFDGVFDVARAVEDPDNPDYIRPDFDSGDGLHLNDAGARAMAETFDITALTQRSRHFAPTAG